MSHFSHIFTHSCLICNASQKVSSVPPNFKGKRSTDSLSLCDLPVHVPISDRTLRYSNGKSFPLTSWVYGRWTSLSPSTHLFPTNVCYFPACSLMTVLICTSHGLLFALQVSGSFLSNYASSNGTQRLLLWNAPRVSGSPLGAQEVTITPWKGARAGFENRLWGSVSSGALRA